MPLLHKPSKAKLDHSAPVVSTPPASSDGFKSFFKKKSPPPKAAPQYGYSGTSQPRPILRPSPPPAPSSPSPLRQQAPAPVSAIRFAGMGGVSGNSASCAPVPEVVPQTAPAPRIVTTVPSPSRRGSPDSPVIPMKSPARAAARPPTTHMSRPAQIARRSSRPTSPATYSFGARTSVVSTMMASPPGCRTPSSPSSPSSSASSSPSRQVSTPPTSHSSIMPSSPCGRRRSSRLPVDYERRRATLFDGSATSAPGTPVSILAAEEGVPMLNVIPATPQQDGDDFSAIEHPGSAVETVAEQSEQVVVEDVAVEPDVETLGDVASLAQVAERQLEYMEATEHFDASFSQPQLDLSFNFSSFAPLDIRPSSPINLSFEPERPISFGEDGGSVSPPFESYPSLPSLPSLSSHLSNNDLDNDSSDSDSSAHEFPDVEEALGHMLASLSDVRLSDLPQLQEAPQLPELPPTPKICDEEKGGFGLGFDLDMGRMSTVTAPLSPRRRRPPPLDLSKRKTFTPLVRLPPAISSSEGDFARRTTESRAPTSAPLYNHRTGFYHPKAASATSMSQGLGTLPSFGAFNIDWDLGSDFSRRLAVDVEEIDPSSSHKRTASDTVSILSENSDDDLHTASIISLTPILANGRIDMREEVLDTEVGVAY